MNYLTNYYKNLSEKLQQRVNLLESHVQMVNEALTTTTAYGSYGRPETADLYGNQGYGAGMAGDYNGDGRVDGADLGIALGNYGQPGYDFQTTLQNWTYNQPAMFRTAQSTPARGRTSRPTADSMNGDYTGQGSGIPGDYNGDGRVDGADLGIALGNYGQPGYDFQTTLQNWTGSQLPGNQYSFGTPAPRSTRRQR